ncbi:MAG: Flp pilus assembly complex ATPase component TadA [bacterium]|nr:Flp pilus assembly complex ATPase component TadA [bacterium]
MEVNGAVLQELLERMNLLCDNFVDGDGEVATVPYSLSQLLEIAVTHKSSSLNINVGSAPALRINGVLSLVESAPLSGSDCRKLLSPVLTAHLKSQLVKSGHAQTCVAGSGTGFKVNLFLERGNLCASFKRLRIDIPKLETLGLDVAFVEKILEQPTGLILLSGLPRSGKINTLAALISYLNDTRLMRIVDLERPIQFWHENRSSTILQREIGLDTPSFASGIKQAMDLDADVIGISELPDREAAALAIRAAVSKKLVIAVLDATSSVQSLERLVSSFSEGESRRYLPVLSNALRVVIHQTLVNRNDNRGVIPTFEILANNDPICAQLKDGKVDQLDRLMREGNMQTLGKSLSRLVSIGLVAEDEAKRYVSDPEEIKVNKDPLVAAATAPLTENGQAETSADDMDVSDTPLMSWL